MHFFIIIIVGMVLLSDRDLMEYSLVFAPGWSGSTAVVASVFALMMIWIRAARKRIFRELETGRIPIDLIQRTYVRSQHGLRILLLAGQFLLIFGTEWPEQVRVIFGTHYAGLDELIILLPFLGWFLAGYYFLYPADRAIRESILGHLAYLSEPVHPIWNRNQYLSFHLRFQVLLLGLPLLMIIAARDLIDIPRHHIVGFSQSILAEMNLEQFAVLVPEVILIVIAGFIFLISPFLVKWVWRARTLPDGELRTMLLGLAESANLRYRDILLWPTYGVIVNAAVVGFLGRMRYIMLSDGLIESLTDGQIESVFGHEIGHVRLHHLPYMLLFAFVSMALIGLAGFELQMRLNFSAQLVEMITLAAIILVWMIAFGFISRNFEAQSDLFGAQLLSREFDQGGCPYKDCLRHNTPVSHSIDPSPVCRVSAELFCSALERTASLNAVSRTSKSWRHGSIRQRCSFLMKSAENFSVMRAFESQIGWIKLILLLGLVLAILWAILTFSYLPDAEMLNAN